MPKQSHKSSIAENSLLARIARAWPLAPPAVDVAISIWAYTQTGDASDARGMTALVLEIVARLLLWSGFYFLFQAAFAFVRTVRFPVLHALLRWTVLFVLALVLAYFFFAWAYTIANSGPPSTDIWNFLIDNLGLLPQHLIQTSPLIAIGGPIFAMLLAIACERAVLEIQAIRRYSLVNKSILALLMLAGAVSIIRVEQGLAEPVRTASPMADAYIASLPDKQRGGDNNPPKRYPTIVILAESLRYDLLTKHAEAIPFLKSLAENGMSFERSYATASHSNLTDLAFWYSQFPLKGERMESYPATAPWRGISLFQVFKSAGYDTAYISSQNERWGDMLNWLDVPEVDYFFHSENYGGDTWENMDDRPGLASMIKRGLVTAGKIEDSGTLRVAKDWIGKLPRESTFFLGMNLQNTHFSYVMPPGGIEPYQPSELGFRAIYYRWPEKYKDNVRNRYLNAVTNLDHLLADFSAYLKAKGLWDECIFVVVGDNGEGFYEHGFGNHSGPMYDEAVRTLSLVKLPKSLQQQQRQIVRHAISHVDIAATIPRIAGLDIPDSFQGKPLYPESAERRPVFMYSNGIVRQYGIVSWPWKLLVTVAPRKKTELFKLDTDQAEIENLATSHNVTMDSLKDQLDFWIDAQLAYYRSEAYARKSAPRYDEQAGGIPIDGAM